MPHWGERGPREPTLQEQRAVTEPTQRPQRARKDKRRWCGGHVGREHVPATRLSKWGTYRQTTGGHVCGWHPRYRWLRDGEPIPEGAIRHSGGRWYSVITGYRWECSHEIGCERCGKVLEPRIGRRCPEYKERT
jgi:hypothetical protein